MTDHSENMQEAATVAASAYMTAIARRVAQRLWWIVALALAAVGAGFAAADLRWAIVGFMLLLIVFPGAMSIAVLAYAARPAVVALTRLDSVSVTESVIEAFDVDGRLLASVPRAAVRGASVAGSNVVISHGAPPDAVLIIPQRMLTPADLSDLLASSDQIKEM